MLVLLLRWICCRKSKQLYSVLISYHLATVDCSKGPILFLHQGMGCHRYASSLLLEHFMSTLWRLWQRLAVQIIQDNIQTLLWMTDKIFRSCSSIVSWRMWKSTRREVDISVGAAVEELLQRACLIFSFMSDSLITFIEIAAYNEVQTCKTTGWMVLLGIWCEISNSNSVVSTFMPSFFQCLTSLVHSYKLSWWCDCFIGYLQNIGYQISTYLTFDHLCAWVAKPS